MAASVKYLVDIFDGPSAGEAWDAGKYAKGPHSFSLIFSFYEEGGLVPGSSTWSRELKKLTFAAWVYSVGYLDQNDPTGSTLVIEARIEFPGLPDDTWVTIHYDPRLRKGGIVQPSLQ